MPNLNELKTSLINLKQENLGLAREQKELDGKIGGLSFEIEHASKNEQQARNRIPVAQNDLRQKQEKNIKRGNAIRDSQAKIDELTDELVACFKKMEKSQKNPKKFKELEAQFKTIQSSLNFERLRNATLISLSNKTSIDDLAAVKNMESIASDVLKFHKQKENLVSEKHNTERMRQEIAREIKNKHDRIHQLETQIIAVRDEKSDSAPVSFAAVDSQTFFKKHNEIENTFDYIIDTAKNLIDYTPFKKLKILIQLGELLLKAFGSDVIGEKQKTACDIFIEIGEELIGKKMPTHVNLIKDKVKFIYNELKQVLANTNEPTVAAPAP